MFIVLKTEGKHESVDYATILTFDNFQKANEYCEKVSTGKQKHWVKAEVMYEGNTIELMQPEDELS